MQLSGLQAASTSKYVSEAASSNAPSTLSEAFQNEFTTEFLKNKNRRLIR